MIGNQICEIREGKTNFARFPSNTAMKENKNIELLAQALKANKSVTDLDLSFCGLNDEGIKAIAEAIKESQSIERINLRGNGMTDVGAKEIALALETNTSVHWVDLQQNKIGDAGAAHMAQTLKITKQIIHLDLKSNKISNDGADAIGEALSINRTLHCIYIEYNHIGDQGAKAIFTGLKQHPSLEWISLSNNKITDASTETIASAIEENISLTSIDISHNMITTEGTSIIIKSLEKNKIVTNAFIYSKNLLVPDKSITDIMKRNKKLENKINAFMSIFEATRYSHSKKTIELLQKNLQHALETIKFLDNATYPQNAFYYRRIKDAIALLKADIEIHEKRYDAGYEILNNMKSDNQFYKEAQDRIYNPARLMSQTEAISSVTQPMLFINGQNHEHGDNIIHRNSRECTLI